MSHSAWRRAHKLLENLGSVPSAQHDAWLERNEADPEVRAKVRALLDEADDEPCLPAFFLPPFGRHEVRHTCETSPPTASDLQTEAGPESALSPSQVRALAQRLLAAQEAMRNRRDAGRLPVRLTQDGEQLPQQTSNGDVAARIDQAEQDREQRSAADNGSSSAKR